MGIECTAHTFGIGVVHNKKILANIRDMYRPEKGGIVPLDAAKHHQHIALSLYQQALDNANINEKKIKAIALSNAPGLAPCLLEGLRFAQQKAQSLSIPIIPVTEGGVNHD